MAEIRDIKFKVDSTLINLLKDLRETAKHWIEGTESHESEDCPEELKEGHTATEKAYREAAIQILEVIKRHEK